MMSELIKRGEVLARESQRRRVRELAERMRGMFGSAAVEVEEARVLVRGGGMVKRWLIDPSLRFLGGGLR